MKGMLRAITLDTLLAATAMAASACESALPLKGSVSIKTCDPRAPDCVPAAKLNYEYTQAIPDDPKSFTVALQSSPWRFYDQDMRILTPEELAAMIRAHWKAGMEKVVLHASWTGVAPDAGGKSLGQKLSAALGGFPVQGTDGFLWISKDGSMRTTHQAFSMKQGVGPYGAKDGDEVMVSLVAGWPAEVEHQFAEKKDADGLMRAGAAWDIYHLCPDHALQTFEAAAKLSSAVAAYNAALMRLERNAPGDVEAARLLLAQAADSGDAKAKERLSGLRQRE